MQEEEVDLSFHCSQVQVGDVVEGQEVPCLDEPYPEDREAPCLDDLVELQEVHEP